MTETNIYRATPRQAFTYMCDIIEAGLVPNLISSPGIGKSSLYKMLAKKYNLKLIDHRLSTSAPEDLSGLPEFYTDEAGVRRSHFVPFDFFPIIGTILPKDYEGWLVFFDEFNSGTKMVQAACYKTILDKQVGQEDLDPRVALGAAGNLRTDRALTNDLSTAMQSRLIHIEMMVDHKEWLEDVAFAQDYDERIIAFLNYDQNQLMDFRPDHQDKTFNCPRTWEFMNKLIKGKLVVPEKTTMYAGTITSGSAASFVQFCEIYKDLLTIKDILANPQGVPVPHEPNRKSAIVSHLIGKITEDTFEDICTFINRMDLSFRILFFRGALVKHPELRVHPEFSKAVIELAKYLNG